ncbi:MAG: CHAT domain-containing tetratricopeptide repeat protein [Cyclobacteriaceae bacterium]
MSTQLYREGQYPAAVKAADEAIELAITRYGFQSSERLISLSNKAYAQSGMGDYLKALANFRLAAELSFIVYPLPHASQIESLSELSKTFVTLGDYDSADHYLNNARTIFSLIPKENKPHLDTAALTILEAYISMNSLEASMKKRKGQVEQAIQLLEEQLIMIKELYHEEYKTLKDYQTTINNLSAYYNDTPNIEVARDYAVAYYELVDEKGNDLDRIHAFQNLGNVYNNLNEFDSANVYWEKALRVVESSTYQGSYIHTAILNNLGTLMLNREAYYEAIEILKQSLSIQERKEAVQPDLYQTTLFNLAESYHWSEQYQLADSLYAHMMDQLLDNIIHNFTYLSDNEKMAFYKNQLLFIDHYLSFALTISGTIPLQRSDNPYINAEIPGALYDLQLTTKAIILNASTRMKKNILNSNDTTLIAVYSSWEESKNRLAQALVEGKMSSEELKWLKIKIEENEKWLLAHSRSFTKGFQLKRRTWQEVQQSLKVDEAAVEIVRMIDGLVYAALIVTPQTTEQPVLSLIMSTQSKRLDEQFYKNYYNATTLKVEDTLSYPTYWQPIVDSIRSHLPNGKMPKRVYISNDGIYNQINLNTLWDNKSHQYVIDQTEVVVVTNTKELLETRTNTSAKEKNAVLFGRPQFSVLQNTTGGFLDLPGTGKEVELLGNTLRKAKWKASVFTELNATESNLKSADNPVILHLASHGYFTPPDDEVNSLAEAMVRSGIALAGVNDTGKEGEDGLLTALEMSSLNLDATHLVVLSACETGKGVVNNGEGVYGLQRAIHVAGAQHMVMSLWKVDDAATQQLMVDFYTRWMQTGDMRESFRSAQLTLRKAYPQPYYWGAFILTGQ